ncbi:P-loop NTPase fold protein [Blastococcus sp. SYSU D00922]
MAARLLSAVAGDEQPLVVIARLASALGLPAEEVLTLSSNDADFGPSTAEMAGRAREVPRRLGLPALTHVRHLLATAIGDEQQLAPSVLQALRVSAPELRRRLRAAVEAVVPAEAPAGWDQLLGVVTAATELAGGFSRDIVGGEERIPPTDDHLGVGTYVSMLASVIARRDTPLPLSVGLFGEWGSGKSYFMGLLRDRVHALSQSGDEAYLGEIVPITFNAWHYADTNLWASLGNEIFEQLSGPEATASQRREALRTELADKTQRAQDLRAANRRAEEETARLREELDRAKTAAATSSLELLRALPRSPTIQRRLTKAFRRLGVSAEAEQAQLLSAELGGVHSDAQALRLATRGRRGWLPAALAVAALAALAVSVFFADDIARLLAGGGLTGLAAALGWLTVVVARTRSGLQTLTTAASEIRAEASRSADERLAPEYSELRRRDARAAVLKSQLAEVLQRVGEIGRELADLDPGRRFYGFVSDRAVSDDYRRELGLISTIRRDFEQLITLLKEWQELDEPETHRPIERIVLYIDDLDRCSSDQVVDVLQAVHLLLALDLFVVVVGVDPRWLLHSLREQYRTAFRDPDRPASRDADLPDEEAVWQTTPHDYLEKIFNIPFVLPGMTATSFERLIRELSLGEEQEVEGPGGDPATPPAARATGEGPVADDGRDDVGAPAGVPSVDAALPGDKAPADARPLADVPVQEGSEIAAIGAGRRPVPRRLTEYELRLLASLGPLVRSPRQAKRLLNLYRMVRSTRDLSPASEFLGDDRTPGEYQAVGVLLGLLTAHPRLLGQLLAAEPADRMPGGLCVRPPEQSWAEVVAGLEPQQAGTRWRNDVCVDLSIEDRAEWASLAGRVAPATALVTLPDLHAFRFWGPRVARFSFVLSPLAVQEDPVRSAAGPATGSKLRAFT